MAWTDAARAAAAATRKAHSKGKQKPLTAHQKRVLKATALHLLTNKPVGTYATNRSRYGVSQDHGAPVTTYARNRRG